MGWQWLVDSRTGSDRADIWWDMAALVDMADGAGGRPRGLGGLKHARVTGWHVETDHG